MFKQIYNSSALQVNVGAAVTKHLFSVRPKATVNTLVNRAQLLPSSLSVYAQTEPVRISLLVGATFSVAPTWADADNGMLACSAYQVGTGGTYSGVTGVPIVSYLVSPGSPFQVDFSQLFNLCNFPPVNLTWNGTITGLKTLTLIATSLSGASVVSASLNWKEFD